MLTVCNYHYIRQNFSFKYPSIFGVTPDEFDYQLQQLKNIGDYISPSDLLEDTQTILKSDDNYLLVTFDDGLKEQFDIALPILQAKSIPAIFFVNTINHIESKVSTVHKIHLLRSILSPEEMSSKINSNTTVTLTQEDKTIARATYRFDNTSTAELKFLLNFKIPFQEQELLINNMFTNYFNENEVVKHLYMSEEDLIQLSKLNFLGSHTHSHYPLGLLDENVIYKELELSKQYLESLTNMPINFVSYPYGSPQACTEEVFLQTKKADYSIGFTTTTGVNKEADNILSLKRYDCNDLPGGKNYKYK